MKLGLLNRNHIDREIFDKFKSLINFHKVLIVMWGSLIGMTYVGHEQNKDRLAAHSSAKSRSQRFSRYLRQWDADAFVFK